MGLLDQVLGGLTGGAGGNSPIQSVLMGLLSGNQGGPAGGGGLQALLAQFEQAGLGHIAQSWVGSGPNQPVSPDQVHAALGDAQVQGMANQTGLSVESLLLLLAQHLPQAVDHLTPNGQVPPQGSGPQSSGIEV